MTSRSQGFFVGKVTGKLDFLHCFGAALIFSFIFSSLMWAEPLNNTLPTGYVPIVGNISIKQIDNTLNISSNSAQNIINYETFSVGRSASVNFTLPDSNAAILNRVTGGLGSEVFGSINSNGKVFLVNPNGIVFGASSQLNLGSLVASTLDIKNQDFLANKLHFSQVGGKSAGITNSGSINIADKGYAVLLGGAVQNNGSIQAPNGQINLVVGQEITIGTEKDINLSIKIDKALENKVENFKNAIENSGSLKSYAGLIKLEADLVSNLYDKSIQNAGLIEANGFANKSGHIELIAKNQKDLGSNIFNTGEISALNGEGIGGTIHILGDQINIGENSLINVSGSLGGGEILIGGDYQGNNKSIYNAQNTFIGSQSQIKADALENGNGGKIIIWADNATDFYGHILARGGLSGGNGGFAEISGKNTLISKGKYDLSTSNPFGEFGTLLFDPLNIQIVSGNSDGSDQGNILSTQLQNNPGSNALGTISYTDEGAGTPNPFIIYESEIENTNANIILQARNGITTSGTFGSGEVLLQSNRSLTMQTRNSSGDGNLGINLTGSTHGNSLLFRTQGTGSITFQTGTGGISAAGINTSNLQTANSSITLQTNGGNIDLNNNINTGTGALNLTSLGGIVNGTNAGITAGIIIILSGSGSANLTNANNNITTLNANSTGGNISYREANGQNFALGSSTLSGGGDLGLQVGGAGIITQTGAISADILNLTLGSSGSSLLTNTGNNINTLIANSTGANISYTESLNNSFIIGTSTLSGGGDLSLQLSGTGGITQAGAIIADSLNLSAGTGTLTLTNISNDINNLTVNALGGTISHTDANNIILDSANFGTGSLNLSARGTGNIIAPNLITGNVLSLATVSGNATKDGNSTGIAINTNINNFAGNTTSGTIKLNNTGSLNLNPSAINTGSLLVSNSNGNITIDDNVTATSGQLNFNAFGDLIIDKLSSNLSFSTSTTGFMNLTTGRDILIGSNNTSGNLNVDAGFQTINAGRDLILAGRGSGGIGGYSRLQGIGNGIAQNINTGRDLIIQMSNNLTGDNNFGAIATTSTTGSQIFNIGGNFQVIGGIDNNTAPTSSARLSSNAGQNITVSGNIDIRGGTGNNNIAIVSAAGIQNITSSNGNINVQGGTGIGSLGRILTTANSIALPSTINANNGNINIGNNAGILATNNAGTLILNSGNSGITLNNGTIQGGIGNQTGSLTLNTTSSGNIIQTGGSIIGGTLNLNFGSNNVNITNADFTTLKANSSGGSLSYLDTDGFTIGNLNLNTGDLSATAIAPTLTANNSFTETNMTLSGNLINLDSVNLTANGNSNIVQSAGSSLLANDLIVNINTGDASLIQATNDINNIILNINSLGGSFQLADLDNVNVISIAGVSNVISGDTLGISANTDITGLSMLSTNGGNLLFRADNNSDGIGSINNGNLNGMGLSAGNGNITLQSAGLSLSNPIITTGSVNLTVTGNSNISQSSSINAGNLNVIVGSGNANLTDINNNTANFSANSSVGGSISFTDTNSFNITASNIGTGNLDIRAAGNGTGAGNITQTGSIIANLLNVQSGSGNITLGNGGNNINILKGLTSGGNIYVRDDNGGFATDNIATGTGNLQLRSSGASGLSQLANTSLTGNNLILELFGSSQAYLDNIDNDFNNFNVSAQASNTRYFDATGFNIIGLDADSNNFGAVGNVSLGTDYGNITHSGLIKTDNLTLSTNSGNIILTGANVDLNNLTVTTQNGNISIHDTDGIRINASSIGSGELLIVSDTTGNNTNRSNGFAILPINGTGSHLIAGLPLEDEFGIVFVGSVQGSGNLSLFTSGNNTITQNAGANIIANNLNITNTNGNTILTNSQNDISNLTVMSSGATVNYTDNNNFNLASLGTGDLILSALNNGNITQTGEITANTLSVNTNTGNINFNNSNNNINNLSANTNSGSIIYTDSNNINLNSSNVNNGSLIVSALNTGNITQTGSITGNTLSISTNSGNANLDNADFINLSINSSSGNILYNDKDGIILNTSNLGSGELTINSFAGGGIAADNSVLENNTDMRGNIKAANINLKVNSGDLNLNTSSLQANNNLIINVLNGNIIANTYTIFPQMSGPNLQIMASDLIGGANSPLGINKLILSSSSYVNEVGGIGLLNYETLLGLMTDSSNNFLLYALFAPSTTIIESNDLSFETERRIKNTLRNVTNLEETYRFEEIKCSETADCGWSCNYNQQPTNLQFSQVSSQNGYRTDSF